MKTLNLPNLSLSELLFKLYSENDSVYFTKTDVYKYVHDITNRFNKKLCKMLLQDIQYFATNEVEYSNGNTTLPLTRIDASEPDNISEFFMYQIPESMEDRETNVFYYVINPPFYSLNVKGLTNLIEFTFSVIWAIIEGLGEDEYSILAKETNKGIYEEKEREKRKVYIYKPMFAEHVNEFIAWLRREKFISGDLQVAVECTNFARLYFILKEEGVLETNLNNTKGITAFFKEFGVDVVETINNEIETPQITRKTVTNDNALDTTLLVSPEGAGNIYGETVKKIRKIFRIGIN